MNTKSHSMQTAVPAAIKKANEVFKAKNTKYVKPKGFIVMPGMVNTKRKIYDEFILNNEPHLASEMAEYLEAFGYNPASVRAMMSEMFNAGMLTRTKLAPYGYSLVSDCPVPPDHPLTFRPRFSKVKEKAMMAVKPLRKPQETKTESIPNASTIDLIKVDSGAPIELIDEIRSSLETGISDVKIVNDLLDKLSYRQAILLKKMLLEN